MGNEGITVLHADEIRDWRGGQRQVMLLLEGLNRRGIRSGLACRNGSELLNRCRLRSIPALSLPFLGELDLLSAAMLAGQLKRGKFRILHAHTARSLGVCLLAKMAVPSTVLVSTRHVAFSVKRRFWGVVKYDNRLLDGIVCVSDAVRRALLADGVDERKLHVIHGGIDVSRFRGIRRSGRSGGDAGIPRNRTVVGTVAAFTREKDYSSLLEAARLVLQKRPSVVFVAVGDGPERDRIVRRSREYGLAGRFRFAGFQGATEDQLKLFDVFVLASKREGLGLSLIEAQCAGLPVVATCVGGIPEIISHGRNGILVPPRNPQALAAGILRLADDAALRRRLGKAGARSALKFSDDRMVDRTLRLYRTLLER
jgi:glycosyltransferase involved in cell wall biosynthesis